MAAEHVLLDGLLSCRAFYRLHQSAKLPAQLAMQLAAELQWNLERMQKKKNFANVCEHLTSQIF